MSELNINSFFETLKNEREEENTKRILKLAKVREDQWWKLYKEGLIKYE